MTKMIDNAKQKTLYYSHESTKDDTAKAKRRPKKIAVQDNEDVQPPTQEVDILPTGHPIPEKAE